MEDRIYRTRSLGVAATGIPDQYADGRAAKVWELYMGSKVERTKAYKDWVLAMMAKWSVRSIADVACGTGVDSMMLVEHGFRVISCDASDKMLKYALEDRWRRRKEPSFDAWVIKEANWLTLASDLECVVEKPDNGFDAVICMGNSFAHLPDFEGQQLNHKIAIENFYAILRPGGILIIDHRNYDYMLATGTCPQGKNIYYPSSHIKDITCSNLFVNNKPAMITLDYVMDVSSVSDATLKELKIDLEEKGDWKFRLSYYPHRLDAFNKLLEGAFGKDAHHELYGDFKPLDPTVDPCYYIHIIQKPLLQ